MTQQPTARSIIGTFLTVQVLFAVATSLIWGVNTLFLLKAGLDIFQVFLVNTFFTVGDLVFQVPTGVIADTLGRKVSFLLSIGTLIVSTLVYLAAYQYHWGFWAFAWASVFLGLGFTFYTGALDAWMVDGLDSIGYASQKEQVFAWAGAAFTSAVLVGTLAGGFLGQANLALPYLARAAALACTFVVAVVMMKETGFTPKALTWAGFRTETRRIAVEGVSYGAHNRVVRPLLLISATGGVFYIFGFYSWQPFFLGLLGTQAIWLTGVVSALFALAGIAGNLFVSRTQKLRAEWEAGKVLGWISLVGALAIFAAGLVGILTPPSAHGVGPFALAVACWLVFGLTFGLGSPIRQGLINRHVPSAMRATVLSLDSLASDAGGSLGQPGLGFVSRALSIPLAWLIGSVFVGAGVPLYRSAARGASEADEASAADVTV